MRCPIESQENAALLLDYCARKLDPGVAALLERHMESCASCGEFAAQQRMLWTALDVWGTMPVSADFDRRLYRRIEFETPANWWARFSPFRAVHWKPAVPVAAAALILMAVALFRAPAGVPVPESTVPLRIDVAAVDQVERALEDLEMLQEFNLVAGSDSKTPGSL